MNKDWSNLKKYASENEFLNSAPSNKKRVVFMGDSITEFWQLYNPIFFTENDFINRGISGQTTSQMLLRFRQDVINLKPAVTVILAGINDIAENTGAIALEAIFGNIVSMVELAKSNHIEVVLCSILPANYFNWNPKLEPADKIIALNQLIKDYAVANQIPYVDYYSSMVDVHKGLHEKYGNDRVHPNLEGYKVMESLVWKVLV